MLQSGKDSARIHHHFKAAFGERGFFTYTCVLTARPEAALHLVAIAFQGGTRPLDGFAWGMPDYPGRPSHVMPGWVKSGAFYHIRIRADRDSPTSLTTEKIGRALLDSVTLYHGLGHWYCHLCLLMPDHLHALLAFPPDKKMSSVIGTWKSYQAKQYGIHWQENYFDHRIRTDKELELKAAYIRRNPIVKGLCASEEDWPWVLSGSDLA